MYPHAQAGRNPASPPRLHPERNPHPSPRASLAAGDDAHGLGAPFTAAAPGDLKIARRHALLEFAGVSLANG